MNKLVDNVSLQLFEEIWQPHILLKKCGNSSLGPHDDIIKRKVLIQQEAGVRKHPPAELALDCDVSLP
jgi:hypothetical protein